MTTEILEQRAQMEQAAGRAEGRTLCDQLAATAERWGSEPAYSDRDDNGPWQTVTWQQTRQLALELAAALIELGLYEAATGITTGYIPPQVRWVSYLPLAHIAERMFSIYLPVHNAWHVHFCHNAATGLVATLGAVRPTAFFGVPRVWEKIQAGIQALLAAEQDPARRAAVEEAMATGRRYVQSCEFGHTTTNDLAEEFRQADEAVLRPIRSLLGLGEATMVSSAAAPLPPDVGSFFAGLGMKILDVYGMTETTGAFTTNTPDAFRLGTVGRAVPGVELRIADDGEILTRGPLNTPGYLKLKRRVVHAKYADVVDAL